MGFLTFCDNKGCGKQMMPLLNLETNNVECTECSRPINSITSFAKTQMKSLGQVKRDEQKKQAFAVQCRFCKKENAPKLGSENEILCSICGKHLDYLTAPYVHAVRQFLLSRKGKAETKAIPPVSK